MGIDLDEVVYDVLLARHLERELAEKSMIESRGYDYEPLFLFQHEYWKPEREYNPGVGCSVPVDVAIANGWSAALLSWEEEDAE